MPRLCPLSASASPTARLIGAGAFGVAVAVIPLQFGSAPAGLAVNAALAGSVLGTGSGGGNIGAGVGVSSSMAGSRATGTFGTDANIGRNSVRSNTDLDSNFNANSDMSRESDRDGDAPSKRGPSLKGITGAGHASENAEVRAAPNSAVGIGAAGENAADVKRTH